MAERLCFLVNSNNNIEEIYVNFDYVKGMAFSQRVKCANSLAKVINDRWPTLRHLEVSTKSNNIIGKQLSAFNLTMGDYSVESIFQSSKVFEGNNQFQFLIDQKPQEAKKFVRDAHTGNLIKFRYKGIDYPIQPKALFMIGFTLMRSMNQNMLKRYWTLIFFPILNSMIKRVSIVKLEQWRFMFQ